MNAARVSLEKESDWEYDEHWVHGYDMIEFGGAIPTSTKVRANPHLSEADTKLINFLARHVHWTPFGHPQVQLRFRMPIFVAREWYRHTIGLVRGPDDLETLGWDTDMADGHPVFNEVSRRYVDSPPQFFIPAAYRLRKEGAKQGSDDRTHELSEEIRGRQEFYYRSAIREYVTQLEEGIAPEVARNTLPVSMYTEFYETASLYAYARIAGLRINPNALKECRQFAEAVGEIIEPLYPVAWAALRKHGFGS